MQIVWRRANGMKTAAVVFILSGSFANDQHEFSTLSIKEFFCFDIRIIINWNAQTSLKVFCGRKKKLYILLTLEIPKTQIILLCFKLNCVVSFKVKQMQNSRGLPVDDASASSLFAIKIFRFHRRIIASLKRDENAECDDWCLKELRRLSDSFSLQCQKTFSQMRSI